MPGLLLGGFGGARVQGSTSGFSSVQPTPTQAAFGPGYGGGTAAQVNALSPNDPFGVALWASIVAFGVLLWIRHSLPA